MEFRLRQRLVELRREWREARRRHPRLAIGVVAAFAVALTVAAAGGAWLLHDLREGLPDLNALRRIGEMDQATSVFDSGDRLAFTIYKEQRIDVPLAEVSPHLIHAILAIEDQRFYGHAGCDLIRIASAALTNIRHGRVVQGGSTITQQLARQSFLTPGKTLHRKFQELILAARIERLYSKPEILELYLNKVYFGDGLYGAQAASRGYFGKDAFELSVPEAALLAGLVKSPSSYAPTVSMERAVSRRNIVLQAMLESGAIDRAVWQSARASKVALHDSLRSEEPHGLYFKEQVRRELVDRFGWQRVYQGGLRVFTTIDMRMQAAAESIVADQLKAIETRRSAWQARRADAQRKNAKSAPKNAAPAADVNVLQAALIALDPVTGHVRAMVGGRDFDESHFNRAVQAHRQPGSAFKPFVYATAIEAGYSPATVIDRLDEPIATGQGAWTPEDGHSSGSSMSLRTGLRTSSNRAAVRLLQDVGIARTVQYAKSMGVGDVPAVPSLALGSGEVTLQSMTAAYAAFANHGLVPHPMLIRRVEEVDGTVLYEARVSSTRAIRDTTAFMMSTMLADVINAGTGNRARALGFTLPAAGKTGTTNDFNDAWFVGYTTKLVTGVWVGFDQPRTILPNGFAAEIAVPVWAKFMKAATRGDAPEWLTPPTGITTVRVCRLSGKLATESCQDGDVVSAGGPIDRGSMVYPEYFASGTEPTAYCDRHPTSGILAGIAGLIGSAERPAPSRVQEVGVPPATAPMKDSTHTIDGRPQASADERRGFLSRFSGVKSDEAPIDDQPNPPRKKIGG
jgi:1A family penicillin-binding protein